MHFVLLLIFLSIFGTNHAYSANKKDLRIAIIGAGASGLTAAHTLKKQGYTHVTVFEKEDRIGGKVHTLWMDNTAIEAGAVWASEKYTTIHSLADEMGVRFNNFKTPKYIVDEDSEKVSIEGYLLKKYGFVKAMQAYLNYKWVTYKFRSVYEPGFAHLTDPDLYLSFEDFSKKYGIEALTKVFEPFLVACGYGYYSEVPAVYILKIIKMVMSFGVIDTVNKTFHLNLPALQVVENGFQSLWEKVAEGLDVRLNSEITQVQREMVDGQALVHITANGETQDFDRVIVSVSPEFSKWFMDLSVSEKEIFDQVKSYKYHVSLFRSEDLDKDQVLMTTKNLSADRKGHVVVVGTMPSWNKVWVSYQLHDGSFQKDELDPILRDDLRSDFGVHHYDIVFQKHIPYFPHVTSQSLQNGFYQKLEALQGKKGTYYVGGLMNFESVEHTSAYAKYLIEHRFD